MGVGLEVVADLASLFFDAALQLGCLRFAAGIGGGVVTATAISWIAQQPNPERGYGLFMMLQFGVGALILAVLPHFMAVNGVNVIYLVFIAFAFLSLVLSPALKCSLKRKIHQGNDNDGIEVAAEKIKLLPVGLSFVAVGLFEAANAGVWAYIERVGLAIPLPRDTLGMILAIASLVGIPGALAVVWLGIRRGRFLPIAAGLSCGMLSLLLLLGVDDLLLYMVAIMALSASWSFTLPYLQGIQAQLDPQGRIAVLGYFVVMVGVALGPALYGGVVGSGDYSNAMWLGVLLLVGCLIAIAPVAIATDQVSDRKQAESPTEQLPRVVTKSRHRLKKLLTGI
ncbi:MAG: hypothetical protein CMI14_11565 [Oleispira sp.]|nr:hypothetical protein [Oleispira sp.]|tara:strand:- start:3483 stop:4499 length:1017 start_codon:yes stop_codon:yes gene_type:complete